MTEDSQNSDNSKNNSKISYSVRLSVAKQFLKQALESYNQKKYSTAADECSSAIEYAPDYIDAIYNRGLCFLALGAFSSAVEDFKNTILLDKSHLGAYKNLAISYYNIKEYDSAIANFSYLISKQDDQLEHFYNRALCFSALNRQDSAINDFKYAISLLNEDISDNFKLIFFHTANSYASLGDYGSAIKYFNLSISHNPKHSQSYFNRAHCYMVMNYLEAALSDMNKSISMLPTKQAYLARAKIYHSMGREQEALNDQIVANNLK